MAYSELASPRATREVLGRFGLDAKHALGQNFLIDDNVVGNILRLSGLQGSAPQEAAARSVLEIGPGIGTLTVALLEHANVIAVERDRDLLPVLAETTALHSDRFALIEGDALKTTLEQVEVACAQLKAPRPRMLVANLPYAVAATVVLDWFGRFDFLESMTVMVQSEVADRMCAQQGTKTYGAYTAKLRLHARVSDRFQVSPACFFPAPRVESAVIRLDRCPLSDDPAVLSAASAVADAAFAQRRKTIRNSMKSAFDTTTVDALLEACAIPATTRGETLSPEQYLELGQALVELQAWRC